MSSLGRPWECPGYTYQEFDLSLYLGHVAQSEGDDRQYIVHTSLGHKVAAVSSVSCQNGRRAFSSYNPGCYIGNGLELDSLSDLGPHPSPKAWSCARSRGTISDQDSAFGSTI